VRTADILNRALVDESGQARTDVTRLLASKPNDTNTLTLAFALALAGDVSRARAVAAPLWPRLERDPAATRIMKPAFDALIAVRQGRPAQAIELLKTAEPWEKKMKVGPVSADVRGLAYRALREGKAAEAAFQKRIGSRGLDPFSLGYVLAYLGIGRARALAGDNAGARQAYDEFFTLWKNADPDIPVLVQARAEYGRLAR
jgi:tetratricopeptide (TPR) repeat protein